MHQRSDRLVIPLLAASIVAAAAPAAAQGYGAPEQPPPPIAEDGTIQWGTFYKSAAMQQAYERLWKLGACRGTNKRITVPVENNKMRIDALPEEAFRGTVKAATGTIAGGMIAFTKAGDPQANGPVYVAHLHPAGVSALHVSGPASRAALVPGMIVRLQAIVDDGGKGLDAVETVEIITPPEGFRLPSVIPDARGEIVGRVVSARGNRLVLRIASGPIRQVILPLADDVVVRFDAAQVEYVAPGDAVEIMGRLWTGEGAMGAGTVFASSLTVTKNP